jgi:hypothetical protein
LSVTVFVKIWTIGTAGSGGNNWSVPPRMVAENGRGPPTLDLILKCGSHLLPGFGVSPLPPSAVCFLK